MYRVLNRQHGEHMTDAEIGEVCREFDANGDGEMDFKEVHLCLLPRGG